MRNVKLVRNGEPHKSSSMLLRVVLKYSPRHRWVFWRIRRSRWHKSTQFCFGLEFYTFVVAFFFCFFFLSLLFILAGQGPAHHSPALACRPRWRIAWNFYKNFAQSWHSSLCREYCRRDFSWWRACGRFPAKRTCQMLSCANRAQATSTALTTARWAWAVFAYSTN